MDALAETAKRLDVIAQFEAEEVLIQAATGRFGQQRRGEHVVNH
jgi:hypothetical protein